MLNKIENEGRFLVQILKEIAEEEKIKLKSYSHDWIIELSRGKKKGFVFGYNFSINSATAAKIARDKVATHLILKEHKINSVEHILVSSPSILKNYIKSAEGSWKKILDYAKKHNYRLVCKPLGGTMGTDIFFTKNQTEIEEAMHKLIAKYNDATISPWLEIEDEYRVVILDEKPMVVIRKDRQKVIGDGIKTVKDLVLAEYNQDEAVEILRKIDDEDLETIPEKGKEYFLLQKHNLTYGAKPVVIDESDDIYKKLTELTIKAVKAININFASVDIVSVKEKLMVLEINSGVTMKKFASYSEENRKIAKEIYREAIKKMV